MPIVIKADGLAGGKGVFIIKYQEEALKQIYNASKGDLIGPLKTPRGYGLVSIVDISPIDSSDFEMKRDVIYNNLANQKRNSGINRAAKNRRHASYNDEKNGRQARHGGYRQRRKTAYV